MGVKKVNKGFLWEYFETEKPCFVYFCVDFARFLKLAPSNSLPGRFPCLFGPYQCSGCALPIYSWEPPYVSLIPIISILQLILIICISISLAFLKRRIQLSLSIIYDTSSLRYVYSRLDRTLKVINVFIVHCGSQTKENAIMYVLS